MATLVLASVAAAKTPCKAESNIAVIGVDSTIAAGIRSSKIVEAYKVDSLMAVNYGSGAGGGPEFPWIEILGGRTYGYFATEKSDVLDNNARVEVERLLLNTSRYSAQRSQCELSPAYAMRYICGNTEILVFVDTNCSSLFIMDGEGYHLQYGNIAPAKQEWQSIWKRLFPGFGE